eukprot:TRINITY_DN21702_c0_g3_i1.p1 TRINITY_DN21702_c0_g3~~TRINITY_DN21702_c0_g3_i1.p1  ORF type:complete len:943 (-),score=146.72 TRINITY_DN21702_c0_g3_i1:29-2716(-)
MEAWDLHVRVFYVAPHIIVVNACSVEISVRQASAAEMTLLPQQRAPLHWRESNQPQEIEARINEGNWRWSGKLPVTSVGEYTFQCFKESPVSFENLRLEVRTVEATNFIIFREENPRLIAYQIRNDTAETLCFKQHKAEAPAVELAPHTSTPFAWYEPSLPKRLEVSYSRNPLNVSRVDFDHSREGYRSLPTRFHVAGVILFNLSMRGPTLVLRAFGSSKASNSDGGADRDLPGWDLERQPPHIEVDVRLAGVGVSVVAPALQSSGPRGGVANSAAFRQGEGLDSRSEKNTAISDVGSGLLRSELLFVSLINVSIDFKRSKTHEEVRLQLQRMQVDNQREDALHPVALSGAYKTGRRGTCGPSQALPIHLGYYGFGGGSAPLVAFHACRLLDPALVYFDDLSLHIQNVDLRLDAGLLLDLGDLWQGLFGEADSPAASTPSMGGRGQASTRGMVSRDDTSRPQPELDSLGADVAQEGQKLYFRSVVFGKTKVSLTFSGGSGLRAPRGFSGDIGFWYRLAASMSSVESTALPFEAFRLTHQTMLAPSFQAAIREHYSGQCFSLPEIASIVGSLEVLGNPRGLIRHVWRGCKLLCWEPYQGATKSPEDALEGIVMGGVSCVRNAVYGSCQSLSKVAGATSQCCVVCLREDPRPGLARLRQGERSHLVQALQGGMTSMARGIADGCTGLCLHPWSGVQERGASGLARGLAKGIAGILLKPAIGCCDMTRQTAEGISYAAMSSDNRQLRRVRPPRALYGWERVLRPYSLEDAQVKAFVLSCDLVVGEFALVDYVWDDGRSVVVITENLLLHVTSDPKRIVLRLQLEDIAHVKYSPDRRSVQIICHPSRRGGESGSRSGGFGTSRRDVFSDFVRLEEEAAMLRLTEMLSSVCTSVGRYNAV